MNTVLRSTVLISVFFLSVAASDYNLRSSDGRVIAKLQANVSWTIQHKLINGTIKQLSLTLPQSSDVHVSGDQTNTTTIINVTWGPPKTEPLFREVGQYVWEIHFSADSAGQVKMDLSKLYYSLYLINMKNSSWPSIVLGNQKAMAYKCSELQVRNNEGDVMYLRNVHLQPFDLRNEGFGDDYICERDRQPYTTMKPNVTTAHPAPDSTDGDWNVTQKEGNYSCIRLTGRLSMNIVYLTENGSNATASVKVPHSAIVSPRSTCNYDPKTRLLTKNIQTLALDFTINGHPWNLSIDFTNDTMFTKDQSKQTVLSHHVRLEYFADETIFPNISSIHEGSQYVENSVDPTTGSGALSLFKSDPTHYYRCNSNDTTAVTTNFMIVTQNLKVEAFLPNTTTLMGERVCLTDQQNESSDLVPIIVGAALASLVLFVLIAYLVGRARAKKTTYETI